MKKILTAFLGSWLALSAWGQHSKKVLFVIADGIPADVLERVQTPNLDAIAATGAYMRAHVGGEKGAYSETPTISAVGYNSLLTGTWANKHNVWGNDNQAPNYHYWTIFRLLKAQFPHKTEAVFSTWQDNRKVLVGEGLPETGGLRLDWHADGYELDTVNFPHDPAHNYMHRVDEKVADEAAAAVRKNAPDLSWVYLEYTDDMGHMHGDSPEFYKAVEAMDGQVGRIWQAIRYREQHFGEEWLIVITTDHGRDEDSGHGHGGQSSRQRTTWIVTNARQLNAYARYNTPGIVDIMPTMGRWLNLKMPTEAEREIDGVPLIGKVSLAKPIVNFFQNRLDVSWQAYDTAGQVKIWVSPTNNFKSGGVDDYKLLATVPVRQEHVNLEVSGLPGGFYKVWLQGRCNSINTWWSPGSKQIAKTSTPSLVPYGPAWGALFQQQAAEYDALCRQAYNIAHERLDSALLHPAVRPPAIIADIDETLLDNSPYFIHQALKGQLYSDATWMSWTAKAVCDTVPGALTFLKYAASRGVTIFYISNRLTAELLPTLNNLRKWGFPGADEGHVLLMTAGGSSSKEARRQTVQTVYDPVLLLGDNLADFSSLFDHLPPDRRRNIVSAEAASFGQKFIVLPNPIYGTWEDALYDYHSELPASEKNKILLGRLNGGYWIKHLKPTWPREPL